MEIGGSLIPETLGNVNYEFLQIMNGCRKAFQKNYKARKDGIRRSEFEVGRQGLKCQPPSLVLDILKLRNSLLLRDKFIIECLLTCTLIVPSPQANFVKQCGPDKVCEPDLSVTGEIKPFGVHG